MTKSTEAEFEEFARSRAPQLHRSAWLLCGDRHQAEDLVQETLAKVYVRWHRRRGGRIENPAAYAQTTLTRTYLSARRRRSSGEVPFADLPDGADRMSGELSDGVGRRADLLALLATLSPRDRAVLVLRYLDDLSVEETGARLGLSPGAVRNRSMRALASLRAHDERTTS